MIRWYVYDNTAATTLWACVNFDMFLSATKGCGEQILSTRYPTVMTCMQKNHHVTMYLYYVTMYLFLILLHVCVPCMCKWLISAVQTNMLYTNHDITSFKRCLSCEVKVLFLVSLLCDCAASRGMYSNSRWTYWLFKNTQEQWLFSDSLRNNESSDWSMLLFIKE